MLEANGIFSSVRFPGNYYVLENTRPTISSSTSSKNAACVTKNDFNERSQNNAKDSHILEAMKIMGKEIQRLD